VDGVRTLDPVNTRTAESLTNVWSLFTVPGVQSMDTGEVPHGAVAEIFYYSSVLKTTRRMHIYTPPGYEAGNAKYPVFYLLHGAGDTDDAWTSVGRAGFIFDNLLAEKKMKAMIVVMPAGHQPGIQFGAPPTGPAPAVNPFTNEFISDMLPYVEKHYRTINDRQHRAIAGLSMGGSQTLDIAFTHLNMFARSACSARAQCWAAGAAGERQMRQRPQRRRPRPLRHVPIGKPLTLADLDNASLKKGTKLIWLSTGKDDGLIAATKSTVELLKKHGFEPVFIESPGAHSWFNWRNYLIEFTPQLFQ
jgi:enterochelin esterase-like enzyme